MHQRIKALLLSAHPSSMANRSLLDEKKRMLHHELGDIQNIVLDVDRAESIIGLQYAFDFHQPRIVHFMGGDIGKGIALPNHPGEQRTVENRALTILFSAFSPRIHLVILDRGSYLPEQAEALTKKTIDYVVGIHDSMSSSDSLRFITTLYSSISQGASIEEAFNLASKERASSAVLPKLLKKPLVKDIVLLPSANPPILSPRVEVNQPEGGKTLERMNGRSSSLHLELEMSQMIQSSSLPSPSPKPRSPYSTRELDPLVPLQGHTLLGNVFVRSEEPTVTFVESEDFQELQQVLRGKKRAVIIQGPNGIGKTTAVRKATQGMQATFLDARNPQRRDQLETALQHWHDGLLIIDDFHYLDASLGQKIVDYLITLADPKQGANNKRSTKKLVLVGSVPNGQQLVALPPGVATDIEVFTWNRVTDKLVWEMIAKGEHELNIKLNHKDKENLVLMAGGSLNLAQILCYYTCFLAKVLTAEDQLRNVPCNITSVIDALKTDLASNFSNATAAFAALGASYDDNLGLWLLKELAASENGLLSLAHLKERKPELSSDIERFMSEMWLKMLYREYPNSEKYFFFNHSTSTLIADEPLFILHLQHLSWAKLAQKVEKEAITTGQKVLIYHNHHPARTDIKWLSDFKVCLMSLGYEDIIVEQDIIKIAHGEKGEQELQSIITPARGVILLVNREFLAVNAIINQLQKPLLQAQARGTAIIPLIVEPCSFEQNKLAAFQPANHPSKPLEQIMGRANRGKALVKLAEDIHSKLS